MIDPASVSSPEELDALPPADRMEFAKLYPEEFSALTGRAAPSGFPALTAEEATAREAGRQRLVKAEEKRVAGVRTYADFQALPTKLQMRLATEDPAKYTQLQADLRSRLSRPNIPAGVFSPTPPPAPRRRR